MTAELTPMGSAAVRLAERAVRLRRERDAARDLACAYEAQLAKVWALAEGWREDHDSAGNGRLGYHASEYGDVYAADLRAVLEVPDE